MGPRRFRGNAAAKASVVTAFNLKRYDRRVAVLISPERYDELMDAVAVLISPERYDELMDALEEISDVEAFDAALAEGGPNIPWDQVNEDLGWKQRHIPLSF